MTVIRRCLVLLLGLLLAGGLGTTVATLPASATVSRLCLGYTACARIGLGNGGYESVRSSMYWRMYAGHNCTNYAAYRMMRAGLPNVRPWTGSGNATNWGVAMSRITTSTPTVGAVAWWRAGVKPAGSAGHVAYVEQVVSADEIVVSQDSYGGDFSWARITRAGSGWPSGFIHFADVRLSNLAPPVVSGTARIGGTLSATGGSWSLAGVTLAYQWLQDGVPLLGATGTTLEDGPAQAGHVLTVRVTASRTGLVAASAVSAPAGAVPTPTLTSRAAPTVTGEARVGATLTADAGAWSPTPDTLTYRWSAAGVPVPGAVSPTLVLTQAQVGQPVTVAVTATRAGTAPVTRSSLATAPVIGQQPVVSGTPRLEGTTQPGRTLGVVLPTLPVGASAAIAWRRSGVVVPGAGLRTYRLTSADLGSRLEAEVTVSEAGLDPVTLRTPPSTLVRAVPVLRSVLTPGRRALTFRLDVTAPGVTSVEGTVQLRTRGRLVRTVPVRHGVATATVTGLPRGTRTYRLWMGATSTTLPGLTRHRVTIR